MGEGERDRVVCGGDGGPIWRSIGVREGKKKVLW